ncbi:fumarylacetoacetate hydrolase family protein [Nocardia sp. alder85J]|uniref:fumarylacetoacetate hydrolase family protein n=1 Tax=Nocardia sp. alder85J TaxID=2862949 RepID=UPI001CD68056|nr:fumarylacetoacetate hydrolase family protein [Nocardia sp. alder85J]MCX4091431.1 fumarylacetoacetate hydrolase family protein [Nocardia sp. alder85J]
MKFVTFTRGGEARLGVHRDADEILDLTGRSGGDPVFGSLLSLIDGGPAALAQARKWADDTATDHTSSEYLCHTADVTLLAPIPRPRKNVFCVGMNYRSHIEQNAQALDLLVEIPEIPLFFSKPVTAVVGPGAPIVLDPRLTAKLDYEAELTMIIGRGGTWISEADAPGHIFGYTLVNDVSARDLQLRTSQFFYGKGQDTYCPLGPAVVTADEIGDLTAITTELLVNGEVRQQESAGNMLFSPAAVIAWLSQGITLEPGDVITLGTPGGCGYQMAPPVFLADGDVVECRATGIGSLINPVTAI